MDKLLLISKNGEFFDDYAAHFVQRKIIVRLTLTVQDALDMIATDDYSVIVADYTSITSMRHIKDLRRATSVPVIIYSKAHNLDSKSRSLQHGADEYHVNEDGIEDIYSTVKAISRRYNVYGNQKEQSPNFVKLGNITIHLNTRRAYCADGDVGFTKRELDIILLLLENRGKILTYDSIFNNIWGGSFQKKQINAVRSQMHRLSAKVNQPSSPIKYIINIRECGYQLNPALFEKKKDKQLTGSQKHSNVLLIGYHGDDAKRLEEVLPMQNKQCYKAESANETFHALTNIEFALVVINGETLSCLELIRLVREVTLSPILVTANVYDIKTKVAAIDIGADGYMLINKNNEEIYETINALIRRNSVYNNVTNPTTSSISIGALNIDIDGRKVSISGQEIELTRKEFDILTFILNQKGEVVTYEQICDNAWGEKYKYDSYKPVMRLVYKLREKIKKIASAQDYIINVREVGYRAIY